MNLSQRRAAAPKPVPVKKVKKGLKPKPSAPESTYFDRAAFVRERGNICECGECQERAEDAHHCMIPRNKKYPELDAKENRAHVNHFEHTALKKFDNITWRRFFFLKNCTLYGRAHMIAWIKSLPLKIKNTRLDFLTQEEKKEVME
jgi:hypothetical protein